ncbi:hypothetical protein NKH28_31865 [Mesorhizobium sp. M1227]|uniref:hypothetical protein n=1 Tax=Mesorhizobium sp. M1227 TaxID=2957071 RepID=UPI00333B1A90
MDFHAPTVLEKGWDVGVRDAIVIETAGGGGYGPASERSPESTAEDLGKIPRV